MSAAPVKVPFIAGPILCAGDFPLVDTSSGMPNVADALMDLFKPMRIGVVTDTPQTGEIDPAEDGQVEEVIRWVQTEGVVQAGEGEVLDIQAGGDRSWQNSTMHTLPNFNVDTNSVIVISGVRLRVTKKADWSASGYVRYELLQDYENAGE